MGFLSAHPSLLRPQGKGTELFLHSLVSVTNLLRVHSVPLWIYTNAKLYQSLFHPLRNTNGPDSCLPTFWLICLAHISDSAVTDCIQNLSKIMTREQYCFPTPRCSSNFQKENSLGTLLKIHSGSSQSPSCLLCLELPY